MVTSARIVICFLLPIFLATLLSAQDCTLGCHASVAAQKLYVDQFGGVEGYGSTFGSGSTKRGGGIPVPVPIPGVPQKLTILDVANVQWTRADGTCQDIGASCKVTQNCTFRLQADVKILDPVVAFTPVRIWAARWTQDRATLPPPQGLDLRYVGKGGAGTVLHVDETFEVCCKPGRAIIELALKVAGNEGVFLYGIVICTQCPDTTGCKQ